jgi:hypothetical protein
MTTRGLGTDDAKTVTKFMNLYVHFKEFKFPKDEEVPDVSAFGLIRTEATGG